MKRLHLSWVLGLAALLVSVGCDAWTDQPPITGERPPDGTGGTGGSNGLVDACINSEDQAVYDALVYINADGEEFTGDEASSQMGSDCILGSPESQPSLAGCGLQAGLVIGCFPNCPDATIQEAADCVAACVQDATAEVAPPGLSDECVSCTGDTVACGAAFCTNLCINDPNADACIECRCENNCIQEFDICSGLPPGGECG